ncbi:hypothetical protein CYMTET_24202 [Cymbomonas tetramitiformis]|uniref:Uncharacterized protein n=1 Tax=Cymbomonas tetramitiformis TaxID=36881 RepID=A0AAE0FXN7_9CHLO|nr:hypothetical protein CYMTET_24202 [Cymbomonas tetramitiformis]
MSTLQGSPCCAALPLFYALARKRLLVAVYPLCFPPGEAGPAKMTLHTISLNLGERLVFSSDLIQDGNHYVGIDPEFQKFMQVVSSIAQYTLPPKHGVEFMDWFKTVMWEVWQDPVCGDGICQSPFEFPRYGRFGCKADCGEEPSLISVTLFIEVNTA